MKTVSYFVPAYVSICVNLVCLTHRVPHVDIALASPVIALRERLPIREHIALFQVSTLSKAVVIQPRSPVIHEARTNLSVGCTEEKRVKQRLLLVLLVNMIFSSNMDQWSPCNVIVVALIISCPFSSRDQFSLVQLIVLDWQAATLWS